MIRRGAAKNNSAFSLVEVTMALGIMAFAATIVMGLLPNGLMALKRSVHTTVATRLAAEVQSEIQQLGLAAIPTQTTYFDVDGRILGQGATAPADAIYEVHRTVLDTPLPGAVASPLRRVIVQVISNPGRQSLSVGSDGLVTIPSGFDASTFQFHVASL